MPNEVPCILCSNDDAEVAFDTGVAQMHRIVRCRNCDLLYANPRALEYEHQDEPEEELNFEPDGYHAQGAKRKSTRLRITPRPGGF